MGGFGIIILALFLGIFMGCTRAAPDKSTLTIQLPTRNSTSSIQKIQKAQILENVSALNTSKWGLPAPTKFSDINCFALAIRTPEVVPSTIRCSNLGGVYQHTDYFEGLYGEGRTLQIEVPSGEDRKIQLVGFMADDVSYCVDLGKSGGTLNAAHLSPPILLSTVYKDLTPGDITVNFEVAENLPADGTFEECDTKPLASSPVASPVVSVGGAGVSGTSGIYNNVSPIFYWDSVPSANSYEVLVNSDSVTLLNWTNIGSSTSYTYYPSGLFTFGSSYTFSVRTVDASGNRSVPTRKTWTARDASTADWKQQAYFKPPQLFSAMLFGSHVAIDGNRMVVGARGEPSLSTGISSIPASDNSASQTGAVYVYTRGVNGWSLEAYLKPDNTHAGQLFGTHVSISGDTIAVGSPREEGDQSTISVSGDTTLSGTDYGAVYIYKHNGSAWVQESYIKAPTPGANSNFGNEVSLYRDTLLVAAPTDSTYGSMAGLAYVYNRVSGTWSFTTELSHSPAAGMRFAAGVSLYDDVIAVGSIPNNGTQMDKVDVFEKTGTIWTHTTELFSISGTTADEFGQSVSVYKDRIVVGALNEKGLGSGVTSGTAYAASPDARGAVFVYEKSGSSWPLKAYMKPDSTVDQKFGQVVSQFENTIVVGSPEHTSSTGKVYTYKISPTTGIYRERTYTGGQNADNSFGYSVAISNSAIAIGGQSETSSTPGVQNSDSYTTGGLIGLGGAAWLFESK
jgi:hypothetical protein